MYTLCLLAMLTISAFIRTETLTIQPRYGSTYRDSDAILSYVLHGPGRHAAYGNLSEFVDRFGSRKVGTANLERAIDHVAARLREEGFDNVHTEEFEYPRWERRNESLTMLLPRRYPMILSGLGGTVPTVPGCLSRRAVVVRSFDELRIMGRAKLNGTIVVFNQRYESYGKTVEYRVRGASMAAKYGAAAALVRSVTPFSIASVHAGTQIYDQGVRRIPAASITVEDAEMLARIQARRTPICLRLCMASGPAGIAKTRNIVAEIRGTSEPQQVMLIGGHVDSWDVGQGAMDDGGGVMVTWQAMRVLRALRSKLRKTLRLVIYSAEEAGVFGGQAYFARHKIDLRRVTMAMESDAGTFAPTGITFSGNAAARGIITKLLAPLRAINASGVVSQVEGPDIMQWLTAGVPGGSIWSGAFMDRYFYFHHTNGDTMTVQNADAMDKCVALQAVIAAGVCNLSAMLPRD